ncbi:hypothetical protein BpHYR1_039522 [Brachionus plicatilis]|uniref:Uncharacterized protein n=1 Tax=Brachionus plicatilis TaxID=10195 RepID=A0A3M7S5P7_BRAPC|nr:hypothetical protein BpHYR1_039522 [Brachionus plicatilis]
MFCEKWRAKMTKRKYWAFPNKCGYVLKITKGQPIQDDVHYTDGHLAGQLGDNLFKKKIVKIVKWLRDGREVVRTWTHRDDEYERQECTIEIIQESQNKHEPELIQKQVLQQSETSNTTKIKWVVFNETGTDTEDNGPDVEEQKH